MILSILCHRPLAMVALVGCATSFAAIAQQTPITGQMGAPATTSAAASVPPPPPSASPAPSTPYAATTEATTDVGNTTRQLFAMQSQHTGGGRALPIPGAEASASYQRYLKSFTHPIPEFYETSVSKNTGGSSNSASSNMP